MVFEQQFKHFDNELTVAILTDKDFIKLTASGQSAAFLIAPESSKFKINGFTKFALRPIEQDKGRGPNVRNSGGLYLAIFDWLQYKKYGLKWSSPEERQSLAFAITKKIAQSGSFKFRNKGAQTDIYRSAVNKTFPALKKSIITASKVQALNLFKEVLK